MNDVRTKQKQIEDYQQKEAFLLKRCSNVSPYSFYRDLFPAGFLQSTGKNNYEDGKLTSIINEVKKVFEDGKPKWFRKNRYLTDDFNILYEFMGKEAFISPCSYIGGSKTNDNLRYVHALAIDLDYVNVENLRDLFYQVENGFIPRPTYIVNSGTGMHLYYFFVEPVHVWPEQIKAYKLMKDAIIRQAMNKYTSQNPKKRQYEGVVQHYRIIGSITKLDYDEEKHPKTSIYPVRAYAFPHGRKWTTDELLDFKPTLGHYQEDMAKAKEALYGRTTTPLEIAKKKWPEWYERRILHQEPLRDGKWHVNKRVYDWWLRKIKAGAYDGNRYFCIFCLATYAIKCDVPFEQLKADTYSLLEPFDGLTESETNHFTEADIEAALDGYQESYKTYPIHAIEHHTKIHIERNVRSNTRRTREEVLEEARAIRDIRQKRQGTNWYDNGGRPKGSKNKHHPKADLIRAYAEAHPDMSNRQIAEALGVSRNTVNKWLDCKQN